MYQKILVPSDQPVITPEQLADFGRFDCPSEYCDENSPPTVSVAYTNLELYIQAAQDQIETLAATACLNEQILLTLDFFPQQNDPRTMWDLYGSYSYIFPWWFNGYPARDSIELVRRPVIVPSFTGEAAEVTGVSVANGIVTVMTSLNPGEGAVVQLQDTAEGNVVQPSTSTTVPFLNTVPLTVLTSNETSFTALFPNFYEIASNGAITQLSYANAADTGTAQVWSNPLIITYNDANGVNQIWPAFNYYVFADKVTLAVNSCWPCTDRRQDCIQCVYWGGSGTSPSAVPARLQLAIMWLANQYRSVPQIISTEMTYDVRMTLKNILGKFRSFRIPR
jgi:hypothetical protein